jgi:ribokinase
MQPPQIVVVGSHAPGLFIHVKCIPVAGETVIGWGFSEPVDGGKGSNQAIAAARLDARVSFVGSIGDDRIGREAETLLRQEKIDITYLRRSLTRPTGVGFILLDDNGTPAMVTSMGANEELDKEFVDEALSHMQGTKILLTQFEINPKVALHAAQIAHQMGMISIVNPAPASENSLTGLDYVDILIPNDLEAKQLLGLNPGTDADLCELAKSLLEKTGCGCVMITVGEKGVVVANRKSIRHIAPPAIKTVDTSGAGDVFCAGVAVGVLEGKDLIKAAEWACYVAAHSVAVPGTIPSYPRRKEVQKFLQYIKL